MRRLQRRLTATATVWIASLLLHLAEPNVHDQSSTECSPFVRGESAASRLQLARNARAAAVAPRRLWLPVGGSPDQKASIICATVDVPRLLGARSYQPSTSFRPARSAVGTSSVEDVWTLRRSVVAWPPTGESSLSTTFLWRCSNLPVTTAGPEFTERRHASVPIQARAMALSPVASQTGSSATRQGVATRAPPGGDILAWDETAEGDSRRSTPRGCRAGVSRPTDRALPQRLVSRAVRAVP